MKSYLITAAASLFLTALVMGFGYKEASLLSFINSGSMVALVFFISGCMLYVVGGGFFNGIAYSFKRFFRSTTKTGEMLADIEEDKEDYPQPKTFKSALTYPLLAVGAVLFLLTLVLSCTV